MSALKFLSAAVLVDNHGSCLIALSEVIDSGSVFKQIIWRMLMHAERKKYVVDGTNICWLYSNVEADTISVIPLVTLLAAILENGEDFKVVLDASTFHSLRASARSSGAVLLEQLCQEEPDRFFIVTGSTRADGVILHEAEEYGLSVISNDLFRDYQAASPWLKDKYSERLIQGNLQRNELLTFDKLSYGRMTLVLDAEVAVKRIKMLIGTLKSPEVSEVDEIIREKRSQIGLLRTELSEIKSAIEAAKITLSESKKNPLPDAKASLFDNGTNRKTPEPTPKVADEDTQRISEADAALQAFLRPYGLPQHRFRFRGYSWEYAVKSLKKEFESGKPCSNCYENWQYREYLGDDGPSLIGYPPKERCRECGKGSYTDNPKALWGIVNSLAPLKK
jgi:Zc3h12a-like Ribonuclease NYN domain